MQLSLYPQAIANSEETILQSSINLEIYKEQLSFLDQEIETAIADDSNLKNEQQRKARRLELSQEPDYLDASRRLKEAKMQHERLLIELNQIRNEFSVAKLETRLAIVNLEAVA